MRALAQPLGTYLNMKYDDFINEIRILLKEACALFDKEDVDRNPEFRKWRHSLTVAIDTIKNQNYDITCRVKRRAFTIHGDFSTQEACRNRYNQDLQDTINELETIVKYFDNYGEAKSLADSNAESVPYKELEYPQKVTLSWLVKHAPIGLWFKFVGILFAAFVLGLGFSQTGAYANFQQLWKKESTGEHIQQTPNKALNPDAAKNAAPVS